MAVRAVLPTDDAVLARACVDGDPEAFALLYRRYFPDLVRFLVRRGNDHGRAEDIAQETLARAYRYLPGFDASRPVWPWLRTIALRVAGTEAAARTGEVLVCDTPDGTADDPVEAIAARDVLVESLRRLPDRQRDALVLRYVEDRHPADVAAVLGMNKNSFDQLIWRARQGLAREYGRLSGAVLVPLSLRLRRAAYWADTRIGAAFSGAVASAGNAAIGTAVAVTAVTGVVSNVPSATLLEGRPGITAADADTPSLAAVGTFAPNLANTTPTRGSEGTNRGTTKPHDIVVEKKYEVGPAAAQGRTQTATDPTRDGEVHRTEGEALLPVGPIRVYAIHDNGSGPGVVCRKTDVCVTKP